MTEEEEKRYRAHIQCLLKQCKHLVLSEIEDDDLTAETNRRLADGRRFKERIKNECY